MLSAEQLHKYFQQFLTLWTMLKVAFAWLLTKDYSIFSYLVLNKILNSKILFTHFSGYIRIEVVSFAEVIEIAATDFYCHEISKLFKKAGQSTHNLEYMKSMLLF